METWNSQSLELGKVLKEWRAAKSITLYAIAKFENTRIENMQKVEEGVASMASLCRYIDYIRCNEGRPYLNQLIDKWYKSLGYEL